MLVYTHTNVVTETDHPVSLACSVAYLDVSQQTPPTPASITDQEAQCYLNRYPDLQSAFGAANIAAVKTHWIQNGRNENRDMTCPPTTLTDQEAQCYLSRYPDLVAAFGATSIQAAKNHWNMYGRSTLYWMHPDYSCSVPTTATSSTTPTVICVCLRIYTHTHTHAHTTTTTTTCSHTISATQTHTHTHTHTHTLLARSS